MTQSIKQKIVNRIYGKGMGWAFSPKDFSQVGSRQAIDLSLHRLMKKGTIRRVIRGIYDYPGFSSFLNQELSPDIDQVARSIARKFGWHIQPSGPAALNLMGLSTQVPGRYVYLSNGPARIYNIGKIPLQFRHTALKEGSFKIRESSILVQGLRSLGQGNISEEVIREIKDWLDPSLKSKILKDTMIATGWIYQAIRNICEGAKDG
jgi:hypothetical protein